jgi:hypothetical protein
MFMFHSFLSHFKRIHSDETFETIKSPTLYTGNITPPKIRVIPPLNKTKITEKISLQFWIKTTQDFLTYQTIARILFNKSGSEFFHFYLGTSTKNFANGPNKQFVQKWDSPNKFRTWNRVSIDIQVDQVNESSTRLMISNYVNGKKGARNSHDYFGDDYWEVKTLDVVFGNNHFKNIKIDQ